MTHSKTSIQDHYNHRHILLTGATGFLGKVLFSMMLDQLSNIGCIYVLIRKNKKKSAIDRFCEEILCSPVLMQLHQIKQTEFNQFILDRVKVLEGDVTQPNLGLSNELVTNLSSKLDLVIHNAALVDFTPDIRTGLNVNVKGPLNIAEFTKQCKKARMIHISTCYVVGNQSGLFEEKIARGYSPNNLLFDETLELDLVFNKIKEIIEGPGSPKSIKKALKILGVERAAYWGWNNTYCYTKAMAELLLVSRYPELSLTIVRPSIIESAVLFPFSGWNEGINGTAPLIITAKTRYPHLVAKKKTILDIVPVDFVSQAILVIGADVLHNPSSNVYQLASSAINPCSMENFVKTADKWYRNYVRSSFPFTPINYLNSLFKTSKCVKPNHFLAPKKMIKNLTVLTHFLHRFRKLPFLNFNLLKEKLIAFIGKLRQMDMITSVYQPFIYDHMPIFCANRINQIIFEDNHFFKRITQLDWKSYILHTHLPGLNRWIFSFSEKRPRSLHSLPVLLDPHEKEILVDLSNDGSKT